MRVLVTSTGFPGHLLPLIPFARAFADAGHEVCVAAPSAATAIVERSGLELCGRTPMPEDEVARLMTTVERLPREAGHEHMIAEGFAGIAARSSLGDLLRVIGAWRPDVVVRESQELAGAVAAERHGVPHARVALGLAEMDAETIELAAAPVAELRAGLDLDPDPTGEWLRAEPCLTLVPPLLDAGEAPTARRFRERGGDPAPLPDWWGGRDDPLVYLSFGSMAGALGYFPALFDAALDALADLPARVLATTGPDTDPAELAPLPANARAERWVPHASALAGAAAVVCHGGYGTLLGALAHGLPLAVLPLFAGDQWHNARRVAEIGAGVPLEGGRFRRMLDLPGPDLIAGLAGAVERVLGDARHTAAAGRVADEMRALPPVDAAAGALEELARV